MFLPVAGSGWILSISVLRSNLAVAVVMMVVAGFFTVNAILAVILLKMVCPILLLIIWFLFQRNEMLRSFIANCVSLK